MPYLLHVNQINFAFYCKCKWNWNC